MDIQHFLGKKRPEIKKAWLNNIVHNYQAEAARFMLKEKDPFSNPIGAATLESADAILDELMKDTIDPDLVLKAVDPVVRVRAVQHFTPSQATSFVLQLKGIVRVLFKKEIETGDITLSDLFAFENRVDNVCLIAFDGFMACREQIYKFRADYVKSRTVNLLEKADILCEVPEVGTEIIPHDVYKNGGFGDK